MPTPNCLILAPCPPPLLSRISALTFPDPMPRAASLPCVKLCVPLELLLRIPADPVYRYPFVPSLHRSIVATDE